MSGLLKRQNLNIEGVRKLETCEYLDEILRSKFLYCREQGLYPEQLQAWKAAFEAIDTDDAPVTKHELKIQRRELKALQKEMIRKDKALAETAALLVLAKKLPAIWGIKEED